MNQRSENVSQIGAKKAEIRFEHLKKRDAISPEKRLSVEKEVAKFVTGLSVYKSAKTVLAYVSYGSEVGTLKLIDNMLADGKVVAVPKVLSRGGRAMAAVSIRSLKDELEPGSYGILEPEVSAEKIINAEDIDIVLVPGVVFDKKGYRLGYGKGYYDTWLSYVTRPVRIGLSYEGTFLDEIPHEEHDVAVQYVVTEKRVIETGQK